MGNVLPKVKVYTFISIICLLINLAMLMTVVIGGATATTEDFMKGDSYLLDNTAPDYANATASDFAIASGGSFVPFYSLLTISTYIDDLPLFVTLITTIIIGIISAYQIFLLSIIIINMLPKVLGSGWDV